MTATSRAGWRVPEWLTGAWEWIVASDPGLTRLRTATSAAVAITSALAVEYGFAAATHAGAEGTIVAMLLGAVVAQMGALALTGTAIWPMVRTAFFFPVAFGAGTLAGAAVARNINLMLGVFVAVMFAAVAVRRFGMAFFFYGFMAWMGYFFASFMDATVAMVPGLMVSVVVATVWVLLLSATVLRTNPTRALHRTMQAFDGRARAVVRACADLLAATDAAQRERLRERLRGRHVQLIEAALMVEGWSAEPGALPRHRWAPPLRRRLIDTQHVLDRMASAAEGLTAEAGVGEAAAAAGRIADRLARRDDAGAQREGYYVARAGPGRGEAWLPALQFAEAALELVSLTEGARDGGQSGARSDNAPLDEFQPVVGLAMGDLPGSSAAAKDVQARSSRWNPMARFDLPTRQAIQVAVAGGLAIVAGRAISPVRYYWAVIAAFVMFSGTATRTETVLKGLNRILGTLTGLVVAVGFAELTAGHVGWVLFVIVASMFAGFYLMRFSYAYMIFFVTIMVAQLYSVLHEFSPGLLVLRLEETAVGAAVGLVVALAVIPLSTRDTVRAVRNNLLSALAGLLDAAAQRLSGTAAPDLDALTRTLDDRLRQLSLVANPLIRPFGLGISARMRHRLALYAAATTHARALAVALRGPAGQQRAALAAACNALATAARRLADVPVGEAQAAAAAPLADAGAVLEAARPGMADPVPHALIHLEALLRELTAVPRDAM